jgi:mono/diheme cytochrome c family protein
VTQKVHLWTAAFCAAVASVSIADMTIPVAAQQPAGGGDQTRTDLAQTDSAQTDPAQIDHAQIDLGTKTYAQKCSHCHGPNMINAGTITPDLRRFPDDKERFFTTVKMGKNGKMPPWGDLLSDDEITRLWAYISSRRDR